MGFVNVESFYMKFTKCFYLCGCYIDMLYTVKVIIVWGKDLLVFSVALIRQVFSVPFVTKYFSSPAGSVDGYYGTVKSTFYLSEFSTESLVDLCCVFSFQVSIYKFFF